MTKSESESYLKALAERTFLKLWTIPNAFYAPGKELADLIIPFGDDILIISDKACRFDFELDRDLAWARWYARTIGESVRQLRTAKQRIERRPSKTFLDSRAHQPLPIRLGSNDERRFHLVAIVRPDSDPSCVPSQWPSLTHVANSSECPFLVDRLQAANKIVHIFDGATIDLLLRTLDTAPDFIAYLKGRERRMLEASEYKFVEVDLLAATLTGNDNKAGYLPAPPSLEEVQSGSWERYQASGSADRRRLADSPSQIIDALIEHQNKEYVDGGFLYGTPTFDSHEQAMRLLASESRFARRIIANELHDILNESDQNTFWASTVPSPTIPSLRYVWLTYPNRPSELSDTDADRFLMDQLQKHVLVAQGLFEETLVLGVCLPNRDASDTAIYMIVHDGSDWTKDDRANARSLQKLGIFEELEVHHRIHVR